MNISSYVAGGRENHPQPVLLIIVFYAFTLFDFDYDGYYTFFGKKENSKFLGGTPYKSSYFNFLK